MDYDGDGDHFQENILRSVLEGLSVRKCLHGSEFEQKYLVFKVCKLPKKNARNTVEFADIFDFESEWRVKVIYPEVYSRD